MTDNQDPLLTAIVRKLSDEFRPSKIYLFGSRAAGTHHPDSDYDIFVIVDESDMRPIKRMQRAYQLLWELGAAIDVFVYTQAEFDELKDDFGSIPNAVMTEGLEMSVG